MASETELVSVLAAIIASASEAPNSDATLNDAVATAFKIADKVREQAKKPLRSR